MISSPPLTSRPAVRLGALVAVICGAWALPVAIAHASWPVIGPLTEANVTSYCQGVYGPSSYANPFYGSKQFKPGMVGYIAPSWQCVNPASPITVPPGQTAGLVDMNTVCEQTYTVRPITARTLSFNDPNHWDCVKAPLGAPVANGGGRPPVSGSPRPGRTLSCEPGDFWVGGSPAAGLMYWSHRWLRDGRVIRGTSGPFPNGGNPKHLAQVSTYKVVQADVGHRLSCSVTATDKLGSDTVVSRALLVAR